MTRESLELDNQGDLGYGQLLAIFWRRRGWFLGVFMGIMALSFPLALSKKPLYQSSMRLLVESNYENKQDNRREDDIDFTESNFKLDYATQQNLMRSYLLLQRALERLIPYYPEMTVEDLKKYLSVYQVRNETNKGTTDTKIFQVDYLDRDPLKTKKVLEEVEKVYQKYNLEQQGKKIEKGLKFIEAELPKARQNLAEAESALKQFRLDHSLIFPEKEVQEVSKSLRDIEQERESIQVQLQETQGRYQKLEQQLGISGEKAAVSSRLSESSRYQNLLNEIQQTELELEEQRARFSDSHPVIEDLLEKREHQQKLLQEEVERVLGEVPPELQLTIEALQKEGQLGASDLNLAGALGEAQTNLESLQQRDLALAGTETKLREKLKHFPPLIDQYHNLEQEVQINQTTLQKLLEAKQNLSIEINRGGVDWQLIEPPQVGIQIAPNTNQDLMLGAVVAIFLGGLAAFVREALDNKIYTQEQLQDKVSLPVLGSTPKLSPTRSRQFLFKLPLFPRLEISAPILQTIHWLPFRNSIDLIYENIQLLNYGLIMKSLAITSAIAGEGKSTMVLSLALSAARRHKKVLVIDADLHNSSLHKILKVPNQEGLSNLLAEETAVPNIQEISLLDCSIDLLTSGSLRADTVRLLSSPKLEELIAEFEEDYDLILIDTPPVNGMVDAIQTVSCCSGTVLVSRLELINSSQLNSAIALLNTFKVLGIVANGSSDLGFDQTNIYLLPEQTTATENI